MEYTPVRLIYTFTNENSRMEISMGLIIEIIFEAVLSAFHIFDKNSNSKKHEKPIIHTRNTTAYKFV